MKKYLGFEIFDLYDFELGFISGFVVVIVIEEVLNPIFYIKWLSNFYFLPYF
jgi:zinc transporter ZupT